MLFENQKEPPSLSDKGKWRSGKKLNILECMKTFSCDVSMEIVDAAAIVHIYYGPNDQSCKLSILRRMQFFNICSEHDIGVHNNQT